MRRILSLKKVPVSGKPILVLFLSYQYFIISDKLIKAEYQEGKFYKI